MLTWEPLEKVDTLYLDKYNGQSLLQGPQFSELH